MGETAKDSRRRVGRGQEGGGGEAAPYYEPLDRRLSGPDPCVRCVKYRNGKVHLVTLHFHWESLNDRWNLRLYREIPLPEDTPSHQQEIR